MPRERLRLAFEGSASRDQAPSRLDDLLAADDEFITGGEGAEPRLLAPQPEPVPPCLIAPPPDLLPLPELPLPFCQDPVRLPLQVSGMVPNLGAKPPLPPLGPPFAVE